MAVRNKIKEFVDGLGITPYELMKRAKISPTTAYALYNDPDQLPSSTTLAKICDTFRIQPGDVLIWIPPEERQSVSTKSSKTNNLPPTKRKQREEDGGQ